MEVLVVLVILSLAYFIYEKRVNNLEAEYRNKSIQLQQKFDALEKEYRKKDMELIVTVKKMAQDNTQNAPWLAERYADYFETIDKQVEEYLIHKKNPAVKASEVVSHIKKEKKELLKQNKLLQYQLSFLMAEFPMLEDAIQLDARDLHEAVSHIIDDEDIKEDYEILAPYLSPEEYQKLSSAQKYQLALDRYLTRKKKSLWEIGISYERYVGYIYEMKGYKVTFNGALKGLEDLGRDIIAENDKEILIIQCKYWRKDSFPIRENAIFQLYGTMTLQKLNTSKKVKGIMITTTVLSETAKEVAQYLNIKYKENEDFDKTYPCIKCNINKATNEKIYHLPFDQQYDRIQIEPQRGEKYVATVEEAEKLRL